MWIHYFSKCNSAHHYFSKCNSVPHYLISSKCKPAFIFRALLLLERFYFSSASNSRALLFFERFYFSSAFISRVLLFLGRFYFCSLNVSQRLSFVLLGMKQCPIVVSNNFIFIYYFLDYLNMFQMLFLIMYKTSRF